MDKVFLYLIIYTLFLGGLCSCERLDITDVEPDVEEEETTTLPEQGDGEEVRDGSCEAPYTVAHAQTIGDEYFEVEGAWVEGYIVGWINGSHYPSGARFTSEAAGETNLLLADSIYENDPAHCLPIQLPSNSKIRSELNLADNPSNLHRHVKLKGDIMAYFNTTGLKKASVYEWLGTSAMEDEKVALSVTEIYEDFSGFKIGDSLNLKNWTIAASYKPAWQIGGNPIERYAAVCHTDTFSNRPFEYWLITPPINLNRMKEPVFSFSTAYANWDGRSQLDAFILNGNNPYVINLRPYLDATIACPETGQENQWVESGPISLHSYSGILYIGFRYKGQSSGRNATTFRLDNIRLEETME